MRKVRIDIEPETSTDKGSVSVNNQDYLTTIVLVLERPEELAEIIQIFTRNFQKCTITIGHKL